jgi:hypothetical protein
MALAIARGAHVSDYEDCRDYPDEPDPEGPGVHKAQAEGAIEQKCARHCWRQPTSTHWRCRPIWSLRTDPVRVEPQVELEYGPGQSRYAPAPSPPPPQPAAAVPYPAPTYSQPDYSDEPVPYQAPLASRALGGTTPVSFRYTAPAQSRYGPAAPPGQRYGVIAQQLAQTPAGAQAVVRAPDGTLAIDPAQLAIIDAMATGDQERRLRYLERQRYGARRYT